MKELLLLLLLRPLVMCVRLCVGRGGFAEKRYCFAVLLAPPRPAATCPPYSPQPPNGRVVPSVRVLRTHTYSACQCGSVDVYAGEQCVCVCVCVCVCLCVCVCACVRACGRACGRRARDVRKPAAPIC